MSSNSTPKGVETLPLKEYVLIPEYEEVGQLEEGDLQLGVQKELRK